MDIVGMVLAAGTIMLIIQMIIGYLRYPARLKAWAAQCGLSAHAPHPVRQLQAVRRLLQPLQMLNLQPAQIRALFVDPRVRDLISGEMDGLPLHLFRLNYVPEISSKSLRDDTVLLLGPLQSDWPNFTVCRNSLFSRPFLGDARRVSLQWPGAQQRLFVTSAGEHQAIRDWLQQGERLRALLNMPKGMRIVLRDGHIAFIRRRRTSLPSLKRFMRSALDCTRMLMQQ